MARVILARWLSLAKRRLTASLAPCQGCGELPTLDTEPAKLQHCCNPCRLWADKFWGALFEKCGAFRKPCIRSRTP